MRLVIIALSFVLFAYVCFADETSHRYDENEQVVLWANKVGPYFNPQLTFSYNSLPWCRPDGKRNIRFRGNGLGESMQGNQLIDSGVQIHFRKDVTDTELCTQTLTKGDAQKLMQAVREHYWYQLYLDELPIWGMVGEVDAAGLHAALGARNVATAVGAGIKYSVYTHKAFTIAYRGDRVIHVNLTTSRPAPIGADAQLVFTYSVKWVETATRFEDRFDKYLDDTFFQHRIHWFSILNSFLMVFFLIFLVVMILIRTLRKDFAKFAKGLDEDDLDADLAEDSGWKQIHADVFRPPRGQHRKTRF